MKFPKALLVLLATLVIASPLMADTVIAVVQFHGSGPNPPQTYRVPNLVVQEISLPIRTSSGEMILDLDWKKREGSDTSVANSIYVGLKSLRALSASCDGAVSPTQVFSASFRFVPGQEFIVYNAATYNDASYSLSLQIDPDKE